MRSMLSSLLVALTLSSLLPAADAQDLRPLFRSVSPSVVVIRAKGRDVGAGGQVRFSETGSGVLISPDGKVMTAAHVVHAMDDIAVEFLGGQTAAARVVASEPAADLSLLQLDQVPAGARAAKLGDSNRVEVGEQVMIVGAPYGLSYSMSVGWISARWAPNTVYKTMPLAEFFQTDAMLGVTGAEIPASRPSRSRSCEG